MRDAELLDTRTESGASAVEYGLLVAAIAAVIVIIVFALGKIVNEMFDDTCTSITTVSGSSISGTC